MKQAAFLIINFFFCWHKTKPHWVVGSDRLILLLEKNMWSDKNSREIETKRKRNIIKMGNQDRWFRMGECVVFILFDGSPKLLNMLSFMEALRESTFPSLIFFLVQKNDQILWWTIQSEGTNFSEKPQHCSNDSIENEKRHRLATGCASNQLQT